MKIAIPANDQITSEHFGHCASFKVFETENNKILSQSTIENPENHTPGMLPQLLKDNGINLVIAGGIGLKAINIFNEAGIKVITGASGSIEDILNHFFDGTLQDGENICSH